MTIDPVQMVNNIALQSPERPAVHYGRWYTYGEFNRLVEQSAQFLLNAGFRRNQGVALYFAPNIEALVLIYAVYKIGAYFVPFGLNQPSQLVKDLMASCGLGQVVCKPEHAGLFPNAVSFHLREVEKLPPPQRGAWQGDFAYQIFTSGTSGIPKGVVATRENLAYIMRAMEEVVPVEGSDTLIWNTPWTFDVSIVQIFGWPKEGAKIVIATQAPERALPDIPRLVDQFAVGVLNMVPTMFARLLEVWSEQDIGVLAKNLKYLVFAGEELALDLAQYAKKVLPRTKVLNLYGPTEATVYATHYEVQGDEERQVPIGKALPGTDIHILDEDRAPVDAGEVGEIYIIGEGVTHGYGNNQEMTAKKFVTLGGKRAYATGDFGRLLPQGHIEFLGRKDRQVQINGIRLELSEIESRMDEVFDRPGKVRVIFQGGRLHLFYLSQANRTNDLRAQAENTLPTYAVPHSFTAITDFPTTANGKLDETALMDVYHKQRDEKVSPRLAGSSGERADILQAVLQGFGMAENNKDTSFVNYGLDSLSLMVAGSKLQKAYGVTIPESLLMGGNTPVDLSKFIAMQLGPYEEPNSVAQKGLPCDGHESIVAQISLWQQACGVLFKVGGVVEHRLHGLQRAYYFDGFESALKLNLTFFAPEERERLELAGSKLISCVQVLRSGLKADGSNLEFIEVRSYPYERLPRIRMGGRRAGAEPMLKGFMSLLTELASKNATMQFLHVPLLVEFEDATEVLWAFSHMICDGAGVFLLKKKLVELVQGAHEIQSRNYSEFVDYLHERSSARELENAALTRQLLAVGRPHDIKVGSPRSIIRDVVKFDKQKPVLDKVAELCFRCGQDMLCKIGPRDIVISTILNLRAFDGFDATHVIGDCHTTLVVALRADDTPDTFRERFLEVSQLHERGVSPVHAALADFPDMSESQTVLEKAYDSNPLLGINYLGFQNDKDITELTDSLEEIKTALAAFPSGRIYVTVFENDKGEAHIYYLTYPE